MAYPACVLRRVAKSRFSSQSSICAPALELEQMEARRLLSVTLDDQGWTVFGRSADTRVIYVSSSAGDDANSGLTEGAPLKTLGKARTLLRNGAPDWMLLRRGDVWTESLTGWSRSGRSSDETMVIGAYGSGARPKLNTGTSAGFGNGTTPVAHLAIVGIHFHAHTRDTSSPAYAGVTAGSDGFRSFGGLKNVLVEDAVFDDYLYNLSLTANGAANSVDFTLRRSILTDAWSTSGKSQGIYASGVRGLVLEENLFDHNGWNERVSGAGATIFSHSVYLSEDNSDVVVRGNIISDSASHGLQARSGGIIENNLFLRNPINLLFGGGSPLVKAGGVEGRVVGNVVLDSRSIAGSNRGTGLELANIKPGGNLVVADNIFTADAHRARAAITFGLTSDAENIADAVGINDLTMRNNVVFDWHSAWNMSSSFRPGTSGYRGVNNVRIVDNDFQDSAIARIVRHGPTVNTAHLYWQGNRYHNAFAPSGWFQVDPNTQSFNWWRANVEPTAVQEAVAYADPTRSIASYNLSLGGAAAFNGFLASARAQDRRTLDGRYTAAAVINYIREGFARGGIVPGGIERTYGPQTVGPTAPHDPPTHPADLTGPAAALKIPPAPLTTLGIAMHLFTVEYSDASAVDLATVDSGDVRVTGPNGYSQNATLVSKTTTDAGKTVAAVYGVAAPGGYWDQSDSGTYTIALLSEAVRDTLGSSSVAAEGFGTFTADLALDTAAPVVTFAPIPDITATGTAPQTFTLTYTDETAVNLSTIGTGGVLVTTPGGTTQSATYVGRTTSDNDKVVVATYTFAAPGGYWDLGDNGSYAFHLASGAVADRGGNSTLAAPPDTFNVYIPELDTAAPAASLSPSALTVGGTSPFTFIVTFSDGTAVDAATVGTGDVVVQGPGGTNVPVTYVSRQSTNNGKTIAAVFSIAAPGGWWDAGDNGTFDVSLAAPAVRDVVGNTTAAMKIGTISVNVPSDTAAPAVALAPSAVTAAGHSTHTLTLTYTDATAVDLSSVGEGDVLVTGPASYSQLATFVSRAASADGKTVTAIYTITGPGGAWNYFNNGTYQVALTAGAVRDLAGNASAASAAGSFAVKILDTVAPAASLLAADITTGLGQYTFTITYLDEIGINASTVATGNVLVTAPDGAKHIATLVSKESSDSGQTLTAVYSLAAPGGSWDFADNGTYRVAVASAQVADLGGNFTAVGTLGAFAVKLPPPDTIPPAVALSASNVTVAGGTTYTFTVTYTDATSVIDATTVGTGDTTVTGPNGYSQSGTYVSHTSTNDGKTLAVVYSIPAPGGSWDAGDNGAYEVRLIEDAVRDAAGNATPAATLGGFEANVPAPAQTTVTLTTSTSAYVRDGSYAGTNYATSKDLQVKLGSSAGSTRDTYVRFDISALTSVSSAKLRLHGKISGSGSVPVVVHGSGNTSWTESGLTWNTRPATNTAALATKTLTSTSYGLHEFDVTSYLQQLRTTGATAVTFVLRGSTQTSPYATFRSDEHGTSAERPQLRVTQDATAALVVSRTALTVPEGGTGTFTVQLSAAPSANISVSVTRQSGDTDLSATPSTLTFTATNWSTPQTVTVTAAQDADALNGQAVFAVTASGLMTQTVTATEVDDDVTTLVSSVATYVRDGSYSSLNYGSTTELIVKRSANVGNSREAYIRFDLGGISTLTSAKLRLYGRLSAASTTTPTLTADVYSSSNTTWSESAVTWDTRPATGITTHGSVTVSKTTDEWYEVDLTTFLKAELAAGRKVVTLALIPALTSDPWIIFASDETANGPRVVVTP